MRVLEVKRRSRLGLASVGGVVVFVATLVALHVLQPHLSPRDDAVSYYVHGAFGWLLTIGLLALGLASWALVRGLARTATGTPASRGLLAAWAVGVWIGALFPADPRGRWSEPSISGMIHGQAALGAFVAFPIGAILLSRRPGRLFETRAAAHLLTRLSVGAAVSLLLFFASLAPVFVRPGPPVFLGVTERMLLVVYAAWIAVAGAGLRSRKAAVA